MSSATWQSSAFLVSSAREFQALATLPAASGALLVR
jgi:hypothetical protein